MLTTSEYINLMQNSGYYISLDADEINVMNDGEIVVTVDSYYPLVMNTYTVGFFRLSKENREYIYSKTKEYAKTPLDKRETNESEVKPYSTLKNFRKTVESVQSEARKHLKKQSDYGGYHGGVNNTCQDVLSWIVQLEKERSNEL